MLFNTKSIHRARFIVHPKLLNFPLFSAVSEKKPQKKNPLLTFIVRPAVHLQLCAIDHYTGLAASLLQTFRSATNGKSHIMAMYVFFFQWGAVASSPPNENLYEHRALEVHHEKQIALLSWGQLPLTVQRSDDSCRTFSPFASGWEKMQNDQFKPSRFESLVNSFIILFCLI